jgi:DNA-binding transcriptional LysR family regulator
MDLLQRMRTFVRVVECGTFSAAAVQMGCSAATVSRAVSELETKLRIRLLNRTTRAIALTAIGQRYFDRCKDALTIIDDAAAEATRSNGRPSGILRLHALPSLGQHYVIPAIASFRSQYPEVTVDLTVSSRMPHLLEEGYDVAMILTPGLPDSAFVSRLLGVTYSVLCASPAYLAKRGRPITLSDLQQHDCLQLAIPSAYASTDSWTLEGPEGEVCVPVNGPLRVNSPELMSAAVREDMGIGAIPVYAMTQSLRDGSVERVLPAHRLLDLQIHALYSSRRYVDAKIGAWLDFVREDLPLRMSADMDLLASQASGCKSA